MASTSQHLLLSPAELAYLHSALSLTPPLRPDGRTATQFRPLTAETGILPGTNGSARVCFADGTEAVVGVKAEVEKTASIIVLNDTENENEPAPQPKQRRRRQAKGKGTARSIAVPQEEEKENNDGDEDEENGETEAAGRHGENDWLELSVEIPGLRDDDSGTVFLATMLSEALLADGELTKKLWINRRFHWKLYLDVSLRSPLFSLSSSPSPSLCPSTVTYPATFSNARKLPDKNKEYKRQTREEYHIETCPNNSL